MPESSQALQNTITKLKLTTNFKIAIPNKVNLEPNSWRNCGLALTFLYKQSQQLFVNKQACYSDSINQTITSDIDWLFLGNPDHGKPIKRSFFTTKADFSVSATCLSVTHMAL